MTESTDHFPCPCCGFYTLSEKPPGTYEICGLCGWEDDRVQNEDPFYRGGANDECLVECRLAFFSRPETARLVREKLGPLPERKPRHPPIQLASE
jgi:hypothetical protein